MTKESGLGDLVAGARDHGGASEACRGPSLIRRAKASNWKEVLVVIVLLILSIDISILLFRIVRTYTSKVAPMWTLALVCLLAGNVIAAPEGFPANGNGLWYTTQGEVWEHTWLPIGNGYLAAMLPGGTTFEYTQLNIESLWSGGPFENSSYNGGNKPLHERENMAKAMADIRQRVFSSENGTIGDVQALVSPITNYGSYAGAGYLLSDLQSTGPISDYSRYLNFETGTTSTLFTQNGISFNRTSFCSHPTQACTQHTTLSRASLAAKKTLPRLTYAFSPYLQEGLPTPNVTCAGSGSLRVRGHVGNPGILYEILATATATRTSGPGGGGGGALPVSCAVYTDPVTGLRNDTLVVSAGITEAWITWVGDTEYSLEHGTEEHGFSFKGLDPHNTLQSRIKSISASPWSFAPALAEHIKDFRATLHDRFSLDLGQKPDLSKTTAEIRSAYLLGKGDVYLEWLVFQMGRYLLAGSARGKLPANLQGKWANGIGNPWSADYHANINVQMNYWSSEMTGLDVTQSLWDYMEKDWAPRGAYTAKVLYNITRGWVTHNEMNIFGYTGMKEYEISASWANYPEANAWMMWHVWDHFDYTNDLAWLKAQGYPLLKGVASFHLDRLLPDQHFDDGSLVVNPCNSPEQKPVTFGCAHSQQLIWEMLNSVEKAHTLVGDRDQKFIQEVRAKRARMDKGIHVGSWSQLQEWKVDMDSPTDVHRHLSHLIGLYPGYSISFYDPALQGRDLTRRKVLEAAEVSLEHRGNGTGPDANSGWQKVWRAACWAQLRNSEKFYYILKFAVDQNFAPNLFSLYSPNSIFQIDANLGFPSAVLNAIVQAQDTPTLSTPLTISLLPAIPTEWATGSIKGVRLRGGMSLDLSWNNRAVKSAVLAMDRRARAREIIVLEGESGKVRRKLRAVPGMKRAI